MKLSLLTIETSKPKWFAEVSDEYEKRISHFLPFQVTRLRSKNLERAQAEQKKEKESELILNKIEANDFVILLDEKGKSQNTQEFTKSLIKTVESGAKSVVLVIGGAFGASDNLKKRANVTWKLSDLTYNHLVAQLVTLEQIYRVMTIWRGVPYHNE